MSDNIYDCAVVGGGLAGLSLAVLLAREGRSVVVAEKKKYPFHKVCGEYISMESWPFLEKLGIPLRDMALPRIKKLKISSPSGHTAKTNLPLGGFGISRYTLDALLAEQARKAGVQILESCKVADIRFQDECFEIITPSGTLTARTACGAYGKRSEPDIKMHRTFLQTPSTPTNNYVGIKYHIRTEFPTDLIELHNFKNGYCGISAIEDNRYCLCYLTRADNLRKSGNNIRTAEENILFKNKYLKKCFSESDFLFEKPEVISQISFAPKSAIENHVFMVGDTAGTIAPLCGNGMSMALHGAKTAADILSQHLKGTLTRTQAEQLYKTNFQRTFALRLGAGRVFQRLFGKEQTTDTVIGLLRYLPGALPALVRLTHGKTF